MFKAITNTIGVVVLGGIVIGGIFVFMGGNHRASGYELDSTRNEDKITETQLVEEIGNYCTSVDIPIIGHKRNHRICKLVLERYQELTEFDYTHPKPDKNGTSQGNAQSPAE